jgi:dolichol-phosphate mannosyltransferase
VALAISVVETRLVAPGLVEIGAPDQAAAWPAPELTIVIPTYKERDNIAPLVERLRVTMQGVDWEVLFVDDNSPDGTAHAVRVIGRNDQRIRCISRIGRRGLAGACLEGMLASQARYVAVMDGDMQHDETLLALMLERMRGADIDLVAASRYLSGGSSAGLNENRARISRWSTALARRVLGQELTDPLSGFFMMRRDTVERLAPSLSSQGFKILLDIVATARGALRVVEIPGVFNERQFGESKLDARVALEFIGLMIAKLTRDMVSIRLLMFCLVGLTGVAVHMATLELSFKIGGVTFSGSQILATVVAIAWNFTLNNQLTYRDQRLTGLGFFSGLLRFEVVCAIGALSNVGIATLIYQGDHNWWVAGLSGALMSAVWNYVLSAAFVWHVR